MPYTFEVARLPYARSPQGKVAELRLELNSGGKKDKTFSAKKTALKKIVANMTIDRKSTRLNSSHSGESRMPSSA